MTIPKGVELLLAPNPGRMTLTGTNTWIVPLGGESGAHDRRIAVVDPGPSLPSHLDRIRSAGSITAIFLTHHHLDHSESAGILAEKFGATVFAHRDELATGGRGVTEGQIISLGRATFEVLHTPGHTYDSICLRLTLGGGEPSVFTGDTLLGGSTTMISRPDGDLAEYMATLDRLSSLGGVVGLPGHGPVIPGIGEWAAESRSRREHRLSLVLEQWRSFSAQHSTIDVRTAVSAIAGSVYGTEDGVVPEYFERMVLAHLRYLSSRGLTGNERF